MAPVLEVVTFPSSDAFRTDSSALEKAFKIVNDAPGAQFVFKGLQSEDSKTAYVAVGWDSLEAHQALMNNKPAYDALHESMAPAVGGQPEMQHILLDLPAALTSISAPSTEIVFLTLKEPKYAELLPPRMEALMEALRNAPAHQGCTWGKVVEKEGVYGVFAGWDSLDAHWAAAKTNVPLGEAVKKVFEYATSTLVHVPFEKYDY